MASYILSTKVTLQQVSRYTKALESSVAGVIVRLNMTVVIVYIYLLNAKLEPRVDNFTAKRKIDLAEGSYLFDFARTT